MPHVDKHVLSSLLRLLNIRNSLSTFNKFIDECEHFSVLVNVLIDYLIMDCLNATIFFSIQKKNLIYELSFPIKNRLVLAY